MRSARTRAAAPVSSSRTDSAAIRNADRVLFVDDGTIVEQGTIDELTQRGGHFAEFWRQQEQSTGWQIAAAEPA